MKGASKRTCSRGCHFSCRAGVWRRSRQSWLVTCFSILLSCYFGNDGLETGIQPRKLVSVALERPPCHTNTLWLIPEIDARLLEKVATLPIERNIGIQGLEDVGPGLEMGHVRL